MCIYIYIYTHISDGLWSGTHGIHGALVELGDARLLLEAATRL